MSLPWVSVRVDPGDSAMLIAVLTSRQKEAFASLGSEVLVAVVVTVVLVVVAATVLVVVGAALSSIVVEQPETMSSPAQVARKNAAGTGTRFMTSPQTFHETSTPG